MKFARPINDPTPNVTGGFSSSHSGVDYGYINGTPIYASESGKVVIAKSGETRQWIANTPSDPYRPVTGTRSLKTEDYGNLTKIDHGEGYTTLYAHQKTASLTVKVGDTVKKGQLIGRVGTTGNSTGNHLHWEVRLNEKCIDPSSVLDSGFSQYSDSQPVTPINLPSDQALLDQLRAERDTNWNLYQNERNAKITQEGVIDQQNKLISEKQRQIDDLIIENGKLQKASDELADVKKELGDKKVELDVCNGLLSNRKDIAKFASTELTAELKTRIDVLWITKLFL